MEDPAHPAAASPPPYRLAISSMSLGQSRAGHALEHRLDVAAQHGFAGIELFYDDLVAVAGAAGPSDEQLLGAAARIHGLCRRRALAVVCLQPFRHYEGLRDRGARAARLDELRLWCRLAAVLQTDLILIPSNFLPASALVSATAGAGALDAVVEDLRAAADVAAAARPPVRLCYEALAWGTHVDTWEASWAAVQAAGRPATLGLCLDTFNMAARVYADPAVAGGVRPSGPADTEASLAALAATVDVARVFLVQVVDAARLDAPLRPGHPLLLHDPAMPARLAWSRSHRLFYGEADRGAYLPVRRIAAVLFGALGYRGWVSFELFNQRTADLDPGVPAELARRGAVAWRRLVHDLGLPVADAGASDGEDASRLVKGYQ